jgi:myo-inositol-hexaphosphate 3-phosphohydrolase
LKNDSQKKNVETIVAEVKEEKAKVKAKAEAKVEENAKEPPKETYKKFTGPDGKKYLRSSESNNVYDFEVYSTDGELELVGKWNPTTKTIIFSVHDSEPELSDEEIEDEDD